MHSLIYHWLKGLQKSNWLIGFWNIFPDRKIRLYRHLSKCIDKVPVPFCVVQYTYSYSYKWETVLPFLRMFFLTRVHPIFLKQMHRMHTKTFFYKMTKIENWFCKLVLQIEPDLNWEKTTIVSLDLPSLNKIRDPTRDDWMRPSVYYRLISE